MSVPRLNVFVLLACVLAAPALAHAQGDSALVSVGARGGLLLTTWNYTEGDEFFKRGTDFAVGGFIAVGGRSERSWSLGVIADVLYARQRVGDVFIGQDVIRNVIHIPVLLKVNAMRLPANLRLYGVAGPAIDVQTSATFGEEDVTDLYEDSLLSLVAGGGVERGRWSAEVRLGWGTKNVVKDLLGPGDLRANTIAILGGYRIR